MPHDGVFSRLLGLTPMVFLPDVSPAIAAGIFKGGVVMVLAVVADRSLRTLRHRV